MLWMTLALLAAIFVAQRALVGFRCNLAFSANALFLSGMTIMLLVYQSGIVVYYRAIEPSTLIFMNFCVAAFGLGAIVAGPQRREITSLEPAIVRQVLAACAMLYVFVSVPEALRAATTTLQDLRADHWNSLQDGGSGPFEICRAVLRVGAVLFALSLYEFWRAKQWKTLALAMLCLLSIYAESTAAGGRFMLIFFSIGAAALVVAHRLRRKERLPAVQITIAVLIAVYVFLIYFPIIRNPYLTGAPLVYFSYMEPSYPATWIMDLPNPWLRESMIGLAFSTQYFATPLLKLQFSISSLEVQSWHLLGAYNFRYLAPILGSLGEVTTFLEARDQISYMSAAAGSGGNPWATGFRDLMIDFSWAGAVICCSLLGYVLTVVSAWMYERRGLMDKAMGGMAAAAGLTFPFLSPFVVNPVLNTLCGFMVIKAVLIVVQLTRQDRPRKMRNENTSVPSV